MNVLPLLAPVMTTDTGVLCDLYRIDCFQVSSQHDVITVDCIWDFQNMSQVLNRIQQNIPRTDRVHVALRPKSHSSALSTSKQLQTLKGVVLPLCDVEFGGYFVSFCISLPLHKLQINRSMYDELHTALKQDSVSALAQLIPRHFSVDTGLESGKTTLHEAVEGGAVGCTQWLVRHNADINSRGSNGDPILFSAIRFGTCILDSRLFQLLIAHCGADLSVTSRVGDTIMHECVAGSAYHTQQSEAYLAARMEVMATVGSHFSTVFLNRNNQGYLPHARTPTNDPVCFPWVPDGL